MPFIIVNGDTGKAIISTKNITYIYRTDSCLYIYCLIGAFDTFMYKHPFTDEYYNYLCSLFPNIVFDGCCININSIENIYCDDIMKSITLRIRSERTEASDAFFTFPVKYRADTRFVEKFNTIDLMDMRFNALMIKLGSLVN